MVGWARWRRPVMGGAVVGSVSTAVFTLGVVAFACTSIMAQMTVNPTSGPSGTSVNTNVTRGLKHAPATYEVHLTQGLTNQGADCMEFTGVIVLRTITTNSVGGWSNLPVTIPASTSLGTHGLCAVERTPIKGQTGTTHNTFTVT